MSIIYNATLSPSKEDVLKSWIPKQEWWGGNLDEFETVTNYRFDDPAGEVGIEGHIVTGGDGTLYHVPVTYRGSPIDGADDYLMSTMDHSVLGKRWVYDAHGDPVFWQQLAQIILTGGKESQEIIVAEDGTETVRESKSALTGSGSLPSAPEISEAHTLTEDGISRIISQAGTMSVLRRLDPHMSFTGRAETLSCSWETPANTFVLATFTNAQGF